MPYEVRKANKKFCVFNSDTNENKGCSDTRKKAVDHMKALYAAENGYTNDAAIWLDLDELEDAIYHLKLAMGLQTGLSEGFITFTQEMSDEFMTHLEEALAALGEFEGEEAIEELDEDEVLVSSGPESLDTEVDFEEFPWEGPIVYEGVLTGDNRLFKPGAITWEPDTLPWAFRWQKHAAQGHGGSVPVGRVDDIKRFEDGSIHGYGVVIPALSPDATEYLNLLKTGVGGGVSVDGDSALFEIVDVVTEATEAVGEPPHQDNCDKPPTRCEFSSMRLRALSAVDVPAFIHAKIHLVDNTDETVDETMPAGDIFTEDVLTAPVYNTQGSIVVGDEAVRIEELAARVKKATNGWNFYSLVASAIPVLPSTEAFIEPNFDGPTALTVTKDGKVFGHLALFNTCHIGFPGTCVKPPKGSKYQYFHTGQIDTIEGDFVDVGHLTFNVGHAPMNASPKQAADHYKAAQYDNVQTVAADVRAGEDQFGIWVVGALRSTLSEEDIRAFRSAPLSGDWRRIAGKLELVGALAVNVPGFPVPRVKALVASGETETLFTFLEDDDEEFISDYELKLRVNKKTSLAQRLGNDFTVGNIITADGNNDGNSKDYILDEDNAFDYETELRFDKKASLALRLSDTPVFAQSINDFLAANDEIDPNSISDEELRNLELPPLPNNITKKDIEDLTKGYTKEQLLHDLQDIRALLDDPTAKISEKDRKNIELLYQAFIQTDKAGKKLTASGMDVQEFYNQCHGADGKFCPTGGGRGGGGGGGGGVSGKAFVKCGPTEYFDKASGTCKPKTHGSKHGGGGGGGGSGGSGGSKHGPSAKDMNAADRTKAVTLLENYQQARAHAKGWATLALVAGLASAAASHGVLPLVATVSPILANPAVLAGLAGLGIYQAGKALNAARNHKKDFTLTISKVNKRDKIEDVIRRQRARQGKIV